MCPPILIAIGTGLSAIAGAAGTVATAAAGWGVATTTALAAAGASAGIATAAGTVVGIVGSVVSLVATVFSAGVQLLSGAATFLGGGGTSGFTSGVFASTPSFTPAMATETLALNTGTAGIGDAATLGVVEAGTGNIVTTVAEKSFVEQATSLSLKGVIAGAKTASEVGGLAMSAYSLFVEPDTQNSYEYDPYFDAEMSQADFEEQYLTPSWKKSDVVQETEEETVDAEEAAAKKTTTETATPATPTTSAKAGAAQSKTASVSKSKYKGQS